MEMRKTLAWGGAAVLTTAFFVFLMWPRAEPAPKAAAEPDLFGFIKPASNAAGAGDSVPAAAPPGQAAMREPDAAQQAISYATEQPALRDVPDATVRMAAVQETAQRMRSQGASEGEVYRMRAEQLSPDAAARLAGMERDEHAWKARVDAYLAERNALLGGNADIYPEETLQQLRNARFSADEQKRLATYEGAGVPRLTMD